MGLDHHLHHAHSHWTVADPSIGSHPDHKCYLDDVILFLRSHMGSHTVGTIGSMKTLYQTLTLMPAPLFFLGFLYSLVFGHHGGEMSIMWLVMGLAHVTPWLLWWQQRDLTRNT